MRVRATSGCPISISANARPNSSTITSREDSPRSCGTTETVSPESRQLFFYTLLARVYFRCAGFQQVQRTTESLLSVVATQVGQSGVGILHKAAQFSAQIVSVDGV